MRNPTVGRSDRGFTLLELLIAVSVSVVICAAALSLASSQLPVFNQQQNIAGLNIGVRNTVSQLQLDVVNAGNGTLLGPNMPDPPVGISITNSVPTSACNTSATYTYGSNCFDTLNVIAADLTVAPAHPDNGTLVPNASTNCADTTSSTTLDLYSPSGTTNAAATALAAGYKSGDEVLLVNSDGSQMMTVTLTAAGAVFHVGALYGVQLTHSVTTATVVSGVTITTNTHDSLNVTTTTSNSTAPFGHQFCSGDWVVRLDPITYQVDTSTPSDPKLVRLRDGANEQTVAEQVIGFKVGAITWNAGFTTPDDNASYNYFASNSPTAGTNPGYNNQFWLIRSVQMALIARTTPNPDPTYVYRNGFDGGPYQIESVSVIVNPRNMSMNSN